MSLDIDEMMKKLRWRVRMGMLYYQMTQSELAKEAGCCVGTVGRIVRGESRNMYISTLYGLSKALKVTPNWLLGVPRRKWHQQRETIIIRLAQHQKRKAKSA